VVDISLIDTESVQGRISRSLKKIINCPGKELSYKSLAQKLNVKERTAKSWVLGEKTPATKEILKLFLVFGPEFADDILILCGLQGTKRVEDTNANTYALNQHLSHAIAEISDALADGKIDHRETREMYPTMLNLSCQLNQWVSAHGNK
jgi:hypothetical protein